MSVGYTVYCIWNEQRDDNMSLFPPYGLSTPGEHNFIVINWTEQRGDRTSHNSQCGSEPVSQPPWVNQFCCFLYFLGPDRRTGIESFILLRWLGKHVWGACIRVWKECCTWGNERWLSGWEVWPDPDLWDYLQPWVPPQTPPSSDHLPEGGWINVSFHVLGPMQ